MPRKSSAETPKAQELDGSPKVEFPMMEPNGSLVDEVREALRNIILDKSASAAARASAGRTLLEYFSGEKAAARAARAAEMTVGELDAEIARLTGRRA